MLPKMGDQAIAAAASDAPKHSILNSSFPVLLPEFGALSKLAADFKPQTSLKRTRYASQVQSLQNITNELEALATEEQGRPDEVSQSCLKRSAPSEADNPRPTKVLLDHNKTFTTNADVTNLSSRSSVVDLFYELGENLSASTLGDTLTEAWKEDALLTLKIIFNARSIHLGKSSRMAAYSALGWLATRHQVTFLANLRWLVRPVIAKKSEKPKANETTAEEEDFEMVDPEEAASTSADAGAIHDVRHGVAHGYWKDLLNLVVFAAHDELKLDGNFSSLLNQKPDNTKNSKRKRLGQDPEAARELRRQKNQEQNERVQGKLRCDPFYRALHLRVAELFAEQLKIDKALLDSGKRSDLGKLSLAAKWAPTYGEFHDKHTFILSTIAEILFPDPALYCPDTSNRELYLRHIRELFRKQYSSPLRKALSIVERDIVAGTFDQIDYNRVPSVAMDRYADLFSKKDFEHFSKYLDDVSKGDAKISGATLLPSTLVAKACDLKNPVQRTSIKAKTVDAQWRALVQSVRNAGTLQSSIAVCDVSGSMFSPRFKDGSAPVHSAIGLSLLIAEATTGPFGGIVVTFSAEPQFHDLKIVKPRLDGLCATVEFMERMEWGMNTNLVAVFDEILTQAKHWRTPQDEMIKQLFVFSDMQFDQGMDQEVWTSSFDRIKCAYSVAGYNMPKLIFWNLAGHTSKPATVDDQNTALISGYSHGMLKALLETGALGGEEEIEEQVVEGEDGMMEVKKVVKIDPLTVVKKAVAHQAYSMLEVVD